MEYYEPRGDAIVQHIEADSSAGPRPWKVSLHGGHSGEFCDHALGTLEEILEAAARFGCPTYGVTEHAPRVSAGLLYEEEKAQGWTVDTLLEIFERYVATLDRLAEKFKGGLTVLRGFECEVVPADCYVEVMLGLKAKYRLDYMVGSVHHVEGHIIDYRIESFDASVALCGGMDGFAERYYQTYARMLTDLRPEVAAHFDLVRRHAPDEESIAGPRARAAAFAALRTVKETGAILDINTGGYRKGFGRPYPAPWILEEARRLEIPVCFGDDSHGPDDVGSHFDAARRYLLAHGYREVTTLAPAAGGGLEKVAVPLPEA